MQHKPTTINYVEWDIVILQILKLINNGFKSAFPIKALKEKMKNLQFHLNAEVIIPFSYLFHSAYTDGQNFNYQTMRRSYYLYTFILCIILFTSCKKDMGLNESLQENNFLDKTWNKTVQTVARDVSEKLNSPAFRRMIKHEVTMRFDGDANILLSSIIKRLPKYFAYEKSHNTANLTSNEELLLSLYNWDIIANAAEQFPQMQIAVQTDAESWDPNSFTPDVVYLTSDFNESEEGETMPNVNGYDSRQNPITVSTAEDPVLNFVVISQNERTTIRDGEVRLTVSNCPVEAIIERVPYNPEANAALIVPGDCTGGGGTGSGHPQYVGTGQNGVLPTLIHRQIGTDVTQPNDSTFNILAPVGTFNGTTVYRKNYKHEKMRQIRCDNLKNIEGWPAGAPEIRLHVFEQNILNPSENLQIYKEEFEPNKRKDINGRWWDAQGVTMHLWEYVETGSKASFAYYEYDPVLIPNEALVAIGQITVDLLAITGIITTGNPTQVAIYGNIRQTIATGIRSLKKKNGMSEYIGKDDYSIFNDQDQFNHSPGGTKFKTWPDL